MKTIPIIQHIDRAVSKRDYDQFGNDLLVTSTFSTIQGEGPLAGYPAMFVRLAGCNYGDKSDSKFCNFCDTNFLFDQGLRYSPRDLLNHLTSIDGYNPEQVLVITGGEPTLQGANLLAFIVIAYQAFAEIQIETNGTQPKFYQEAVKTGCTPLFKSVVSPKANQSKGTYPPVHPDVMWWASCLKFVVDSDPMSAHHTVPQWALDSSKTVYISPLAVYLRSYAGEVSSIWDEGLINREETARNYAYAARYVQELAKAGHRVRLSVQSHLFVGVA